MPTKREVFIIESFSDRSEIVEGRYLARILKLGLRKPIYRAVATQGQLRAAIKEFRRSHYRYLHISCHGRSDGLDFAFGYVEFEQLAEMLGTGLDGRRVFISACEAVNYRAAKILIQSTDCTSVIGPFDRIYFDKAVVFWASYFYLAFLADLPMNRKFIVSTLEKLSTLFQANILYFSRSRSRGIKQRSFSGLP